VVDVVGMTLELADCTSLGLILWVVCVIGWMCWIGDFRRCGGGVIGCCDAGMIGCSGDSKVWSVGVDLLCRTPWVICSECANSCSDDDCTCVMMI